MNTPQDSQAWIAINALLDEADACNARGDLHGAVARYDAALREGSRLSTWPAGIAERFAFARDLCSGYAGNYARHLQEHLQAVGYDPAQASPRFTEALEILIGRKKAYLQQPQLFYFPGLPQVAVYENEAFPWLPGLEQATDAIRAECMALLEEPGLFEGLGAGPGGAPQVGMCHVWREGKIVPEVARRCPETLRALDATPLDHVTGRAPSAAFYLLAPGARIPRNNGLLNTRLMVQLPLAAAGQSGVRAGATVREWQAGKAVVIDDSIENEAWNDAPQACALLVFDIWRPELTAGERELVIGLVKAIDTFGSRQPG